MMPPGAPPARWEKYRCPHCGWTGQIIGQKLDLLRHYEKSMGSVGSFRCAFDERILCDGCRPEPTNDETDLRDDDLEDRGYRITITHERRPALRALWIHSWDLQDLEGTLLRRRDLAYLAGD